MKKTFLSRCAALATATLLSFSAFSQAPLPPNFLSEKQAQYNALSREEPFADFYDREKKKFLRSQARIVNGQYVPGGPLVAPCLNGGFEDSPTITAWHGAFGQIANGGDTLEYSQFEDSIQGGNIAAAAARQTLVTAGLDPTIGVITTTANGSGHAVRLGNRATGNGAELLGKTFVVTAQNSVLSFSYALVMQNPYTAAHIVGGVMDPDKQPSFQVRIMNSAGVEIPGLVNLGNNSNIATADSAANSFFQDTLINGEVVVYRDWDCVQVNLAGLIGDTITIEFINRDCSQGGHYGYAYIDEFCVGCGAGNPSGSIITAANAVTCGAGQICCNFTVPVGPNGQTGVARPILRFLQNSFQVAMIQGPTYGADGTHCFTVDPVALGLTGSYDYIIEGIFSLGGLPLPTQTAGSTATGQNATVNDDYRAVCPTSQCCPGTNYIKNGNFTSLISAFTSDYTYQAPGSTGAVGSGEYSIMTSGEALANSPTWTTGCPDYGRALIVNGATEMSTGPKVVWQQTSGTLTAGTHRFCADFRNLAQCDFNAPSRITITFTPTGLGTMPIYPVSVATISNNGTCDWTTVSRILNVPSNVTSLRVTIALSESVLGDGNDMAIDNINLTRMDTITAAQAHFIHSTSNVTATSFNVTATATATLNAGCTRFWQVEEVIGTSTPNVYNLVPGTQVVNPLSWQNANPNTFIGYNGTGTLSGSAPGVFSSSKLYRVFYSTDCPCMVRRTTFHIVSSSAGRPGATSDMTIIDSGVVEHLEGDVQGGLAPDAGDNGGISVFPNPTDNTVTVQMQPLQAAATLKVLSLSGKELKSVSIPAAEAQAELSLKELPAGMYLLQMTSRTGEKLLNYKISKL